MQLVESRISVSDSSQAVQCGTISFMDHLMMKNFKFWLLASAFLGAGCGEYGGGASIIPSVTFVSEGSESDAGAATEDSGSGVTAQPGSFRGRVVLSGSQSSLPPLISKGADVKDKEVCAAVDVPDDRLVLGQDGGVANVFVYLAKAPKGGKKLEVPDEAFTFDQKYCRFFPHCSVIPTGQVIRVLSDDPVAHNTHTYPERNQSVNSGVAPGDREGKLTYTFNRAEAKPVTVKCDYHTWMTAYQLPIDHPYGAVSGDDGSFLIEELPPGKHNFIVWHEAVDGNFIERKLVVDIRSGETTELQIDLSSSRLRL